MELDNWDQKVHTSILEPRRFGDIMGLVSVKLGPAGYRAPHRG